MKQEIHIPGSGKQQPSDRQQPPEKQVGRDDVVDLILSKPPEEFLPWEKIPLPSAGMYYEGKIPNGEVQVRPMGLIADKILATQRLAQSGQTIDYIFKNHVKFPDPAFDPLDLLVGDRMFLLYYLRGITHGNNYEFTVTCTNEECARVSSHEYDLNKIAETVKGPTVTEPLKVILPSMTKSLSELAGGGTEVYAEVRFLRGRDLQVMMRTHRIKENVQTGIARNAITNKPMAFVEPSLDSSIEDHLNMVIVSINGNRDRTKINEIFKRMTSADTAAIRRTLTKNEPGVETAIIVTCPDCKTEMRMNLPITESFFRPTEHGRV